MKPTIFEVRDLFQVEQHQGGQRSSVLILHPPLDVARDADRQKILRPLMTNRGIAARNQSDTKLIRSSQMTSGQLRVNTHTMLTRMRTIDMTRAQRDVLRPFWFNRAVRMTGAQRAPRTVDMLIRQRTEAAKWITQVIQEQPVELYIIASNNRSDQQPETDRLYGARLLGFMHAIYDTTMFFEPWVESWNGNKVGVLPHGFYAHGGVFVEAGKPLFQNVENLG